jgi:hypothetical protein
VPQHKDLQLLRLPRTATQDNQLEQAANDQVRKRPQHARPPTDGEADATRPLPLYDLPDRVTEFSNPTGSRGVSAELEFGARTSLLWWVGSALLGAGVLAAAGAAALYAFARARR